MPELSEEEKDRIRGWLTDAYQAASKFDGSESSEKRLFDPLTLFDEFSLNHSRGVPSSPMEQAIAEMAFPDHDIDMPLTVDGFLDYVSEFYERLSSHDTSDNNIWETLQNGGAIIRQSQSVLVQPGDGEVPTPMHSDIPFSIRLEPRLAQLIAHLRNDGVNGQPIYMDDLVVTQGQVSRDIMRKHPYTVVQIPRLNMEIAVCDQVGEITFVKQGLVGTEFWAHLSKEELKARGDVEHIRHGSDDQWWHDIREFLSKESEYDTGKVNIAVWSQQRPKLDLQLIKKSLLAHRMETGNWLKALEKDANGRRGLYILEHGPYAGEITARSLNAALIKGLRGLPGGSSVPKLNETVSSENDLDYVNITKKKNLDLDLVKEALLAHRLATGHWLAATTKGPDGKNGTYVLEHGPYAGEFTAFNLNALLSKGSGGIPKKTSLARLNVEISNEHGLDYVHPKDLPDLEVNKIKESLLAHWEATGEWLACGTRAAPDLPTGSYILEYGPYAGELSAGSLDSALSTGKRGLPGGSSIAKLRQEIIEELDLSDHADTPTPI